METARDTQSLQALAHEEPPVANLEPSVREVNRLFVRDSGDLCQAGASIWCLAYYANFAAYAAGWLPLWAFVAGAFICAVRSGNWLHRGYHAPPVRSRVLLMLRWISMLPSPLTLGTSELQRNHLLHHAHTGKQKDPDEFLMNRSWWRALFNAFIQPERSVVLYIQRNGLGRELALKLLFNTAILVTIGLVAGPRSLGVILVTMRLINTTSWYVFVWGLHHEMFWGNIDALPLPGVVRFIYSALFSRAHTYTILYHTLHHRYGTVGDMDLPRLHALVSGVRSAQQGQELVPATTASAA